VVAGKQVIKVNIVPPLWNLLRDTALATNSGIVYDQCHSRLFWFTRTGLESIWGFVDGHSKFPDIQDVVLYELPLEEGSCCVHCCSAHPMVLAPPSSVGEAKLTFHPYIVEPTGFPRTIAISPHDCSQYNGAEPHPFAE